MALTKMKTPNEAYHAIAENPAYYGLLNAVPAKYPAQLIEAVGYVIIFAILFFLYWRTNVRERLGFLFGLFLVLLWSVRFAVEYIKESQGGFESALGLFTTGQWLSIPFILLGLYLMWNAEKPIDID
jgi:prolipoprotein diacylglyceryltransferase